MPAAAVASRTPSIPGSCGTSAGLSGETALPIPDPCDPLFLLRRARCRNRRRLGRRVDALDLRLRAQFVDQIRLRAARQEIFQLVAHLVELRNRPVALLLDLDDVPAELRLHRIGELAGVELER